VSTPFGLSLAIERDETGLVAASFERGRRATARIRDPLLAEAAAQVGAYFRRRLRRFEVPLSLEGTPLQLAAWRLVANLEFGDVVAYGDVARAIGRPGAHRGVAHAMARAPLALFIPAHRVIGADGSIKGAGEGSLRARLFDFERSRQSPIGRLIPAR
jgi:methylated-DNA-[protein]-cysteine S-methyltransferase